MKKIILMLILFALLICIPAEAQSTELKLVFPSQANTFTKKMVFILIAKNKLRLEHNTYGDSYRLGDITEQEWDAYKETFLNRQNAIIKSLLKARKILRESNIYTITDISVGGGLFNEVTP